MIVEQPGPIVVSHSLFAYLRRWSDGDGDGVVPCIVCFVFFREMSNWTGALLVLEMYVTVAVAITVGGGGCCYFSNFSNFENNSGQLQVGNLS